jgi:hypothetical protein
MASSLSLEAMIKGRFIIEFYHSDSQLYKAFRAHFIYNSQN